MKLIFRTSYSQNNRKVFELTTKNHAEYCERHGYVYMPVEEKYSPYIDMGKAQWDLLNNADVLAFIGTDVLIQHPEKPLTDFVHDGITMCHDYPNGMLNGDMVLMSGKWAVYLCPKVAVLQQQRRSTDAAIELMRGKFKGIHDEPMMQIPAPNMNPTVDYSGVDTKDYFAIHYHALYASNGTTPDFKYNKMIEDGLCAGC